MSTDDGESSADAWKWDALLEAWQAVSPPPQIQLASVFGEDDDAPRSRTFEVPLQADALTLGDRFSMGAQMRTRVGDGRELFDALPDEVTSGELAPMTLEVPDYPVCAVNRASPFPGVVQPGGRATVEVHGFGVEGPVGIWLGDEDEPVATGDYWEIPGGSWPWTMEFDVPPAIDNEGHVFLTAQLMGDSGMTAQCPVLVGDAELPDFDAPAE